MATDDQQQTDADSQQQADADKQAELERLYAVEFRSQSYASYYNTIMEKDKSILTLSVAGIGFLITILQITGSISRYQFAFFVIAAFFYLVSIFCMITIFSKNGDFIINMTTNQSTEVIQYKLRILDKTAIISFGIAIVLSIIFGASSSFNKMEIEDMNKDKSNQQTSGPKVSGTANDSFEGMRKVNESFQAVAELGKSLAGATTMTPSSSTTTSAQTGSSTPTGAQAMKPKV